MMTRKSLERAVVGGAVLALALTSCGGGAKTRAAPKLTNTLTITGSEYKFDLDKPSIDEGTAQVTFKNAGTELHVAGWQRLKAGTTFQAFSEAVRKDWESAMGLRDRATGLVEEQENDGAPAADLSPGQRSTITTNLIKAGSYALLCYIPALDGRPHLAKGMVAGLEVKARTPAPTPFDVKTDGEVTLTDYSFGTLPQALTKGKGTIKFTNGGKEPHNVNLFRFEPGKTFKDLDAYIKAFFETEAAQPPAPPVVFLGGFFSIAPGAGIWLTIDLPPGTYGLDCDERTKADKKHGEDLGMRVTFDVA
jgi:plastocyanin